MEDLIKLVPMADIKLTTPMSLVFTPNPVPYYVQGDTWKDNPLPASDSCR